MTCIASWFATSHRAVVGLPSHDPPQLIVFTTSTVTDDFNEAKAGPLFDHNHKQLVASFRNIPHLPWRDVDGFENSKSSATRDRLFVQIMLRGLDSWMNRTGITARPFDVYREVVSMFCAENDIDDGIRRGTFETLNMIHGLGFGKDVGSLADGCVPSHIQGTKPPCSYL